MNFLKWKIKLIFEFLMAFGSNLTTYNFYKRGMIKHYQRRHMAQKVGALSKMALKVRHHPRNLKIFWNFFQFSQNKYSWSIGVIFDHLTKLSAISDQSRARYRH